MRVMVMVKATEDSEAGVMPTTELFEAMGRFNEELIKAGVLLSGDGLKPSSQGKRVAFDGPSRTVAPALGGPNPGWLAGAATLAGGAANAADSARIASSTEAKRSSGIFASIIMITPSAAGGIPGARSRVLGKSPW